MCVCASVQVSECVREREKGGGGGVVGRESEDLAGVNA